MRIALVGAGRFSHVHVRAMGESPGLQLVAVNDPREDAARELADVAGAAVAATPAGLLEHDPDLVVVASPTWLHAAHAAEFLEAGVDVLVEKPVAVHADHARELAAEVERSGRWLGVVFQRRYQLGVQRLRELLDAGELGEVTSVTLANVVWRGDEYWEQPAWRGDPSLGGGDVMNHGMHALDLLVWLFGAPGETCSLVRARGDLEVATAAVMRHAEGVLSTFLCSTVGSDLPLELVVHGTMATATFREDTLWIRPAGGEERVEVEGDSAYDALARMYADIGERRRRGEPVAGCGLEAAIATLETAESIIQPR